MARWVALGFSSDEEALRFLNHIHNLDDTQRDLLVATRTGDGKVKIDKFRIRAVNMREDEV